jgi:hypothetical protein
MSRTMKKLLRRIGYVLWGLMGIPLTIVILGIIGITIYSILPTVAYRWVLIKSSGEIIKGTVYREDYWWSSDDPRGHNGMLLEDGLFLADSSDGVSCHRTYQLQDEILKISYGNNDLTEGTQTTYQQKHNFIEWVDINQFYRSKERFFNGIHVAYVMNFKEHDELKDPEFNDRLYRVNTDMCSALFCSVDVRTGEISPGWRVWYIGDIPLNKKTSGYKIVAIRYNTGNVLEEMLYDDLLIPKRQTSTIVEKKTIRMIPEINTEFTALRKKFKQGLNITDDKWETCKYWFGENYSRSGTR